MNVWNIWKRETDKIPPEKSLNSAMNGVYISVDLNGLKWEDRVIKLNVQPAAVGNQ